MLHLQGLRKPPPMCKSVPRDTIFGRRRFHNLLRLQCRRSRSTKTPMAGLNPGRLSKSCPELLVHRKDERAARRRPAHRYPASPVQASETMLPPKRLADSPERLFTSSHLRYVFCLHPRLDCVCWVEDEIVRHAGHGPSKHLLIYWKGRVFLC